MPGGSVPANPPLRSRPTAILSPGLRLPPSRGEAPVGDARPDGHFTVVGANDVDDLLALSTRLARSQRVGGRRDSAAALTRAARPCAPAVSGIPVRAATARRGPLERGPAGCVAAASPSRLDRLEPQRGVGHAKVVLDPRDLDRDVGGHLRLELSVGIGYVDDHRVGDDVRVLRRVQAGSAIVPTNGSWGKRRPKSAPLAGRHAVDVGPVHVGLTCIFVRSSAIVNSVGAWNEAATVWPMSYCRATTTPSMGE